MRMLRFVGLVLIIVSATMVGQVSINDFNAVGMDTLLWKGQQSPTTFSLARDAADKFEGASAIAVHANIGAVNPWGTHAQFGYDLPDTVDPWDWSISDSIGISVKVRMAPSLPGQMYFRIHIADRSAPGEPNEEWIYENATVLDAVNGWVHLKIPFADRVTDGTTVPDSTGFIMAPTNWNMTSNNKKFDRNKIVGWSLAIITSGWAAPANLPADSIEVVFDDFKRMGVRAVPAVFFNGRDLSPQISNSWSWGGSSSGVEANAGPLPKTHAIKWTQGGGWTGMGYDFTPGFNIAGGWQKDSVKIKMKVVGTASATRIQFESPRVGADNAKVGRTFTPTADGSWYTYTFALRDMVVQDNDPGFDSTNVILLGLMAEGGGVAGTIVYITNLWTGNPEFDVIPPDAPTNLAGSGSGYVNLVTWNDVPNEPGVRYNAFFKETAWTDAEDSSVEDLPPYNLTSAVASHELRAPINDANVTYYYGVMAKDLAGNESAATVMSTAITTLAKGVPTISKTGPATFTADGDLSEWATITPFVLSTVSGTAHAVSIFPITNDADLSAQAYVAMDATYLYVAFDVVDDIVLAATTGNDYEQDCADLFIGLYDWRGKRHAGLTRGAQPDYHFRFSTHRIWIDNGGIRVDTISANYSWTEKVLSTGYVIEARIAWADLATVLPTGGDAVFAPVEGMRIPIDFAINDRDSDVRNGILCYSPLSNDDSYKAMSYWSYTWIGALSKPVTSVEQVSDVATSFELGQNYPNPFNPTTEIRYSVATSGPVSLRVYDMMGREVANLVDRTQEAGTYVVKFTADHSGRALASGVYFTRLEAGANVAIRKMLLVK